MWHLSPQLGLKVPMGLSEHVNESEALLFKPGEQDHFAMGMG